jgi:hypothetical protein
MYSEGLFHDIYSKYSCLMSMLSFCLLMSENGSELPLSHYLCDASFLIILKPPPLQIHLDKASTGYTSGRKTWIEGAMDAATTAAEQGLRIVLMLWL